MFRDDIYPDVNLALLFTMSLTMLLFYSLLYLYLWPYKIETDPENPLSWYYPFTCSFWCRKSRNDSQVRIINRNRIIDAMSTGDDENQLLAPLTSNDKIITGENSNM